MGKIKNPSPVKLICGMLTGDLEWRIKAKELLRERFGPIDHESKEFSFNFTDYYQQELGTDIVRQYLSFIELIEPGELAAIKLETNRMEEILSRDDGRKANLDPGYLDLSKMVLATTKDATYRVYLAAGISGQSTYYFQGGTYHPWQWTYADYRTDTAIDFFNRVREDYKRYWKQRNRR